MTPLHDNSSVYTVPPSYNTEIIPGSIDPNNTDTSNMGETTLEHLELLKKYYARKDADHDAGIDRAINDPNYNFKGVESVEFVGMLSGEYSVNKTITNYSIGGAGGGYMIDCGENVLVAFGDTKAEDGGGGNEEGGNDPNYGGPWRANTLAFTTDLDYTDGISLNGFYLSD